MEIIRLNPTELEKIDYSRYEEYSPFQQRGWILNAIESHKKSPLKNIGVQTFVLGLQENNEILCFAAFVTGGAGNTKKIKFVGYDMATDYTTIPLMKSITDEQLNFFLDSIFKITKRNTLLFTGLPRDGRIYKLLEKNEHFIVKQQNICVRIPTHMYGEYDEWFASLKKNVRQNIRTAYNRLRKDEVNFTFKVYKDKTIDEALAVKLQMFYEKRRALLNIDKKSLKSKLKKFYRRVRLKAYNFMTHSMLYNSDSVVLVLRINNEVAAFAHGLQSDFGGVVFMQVAIGELFKRYSPGIIMFSEYIKYMSGNKGMQDIDLALGTEKYKYDLGGVEQIAVIAEYSV